MRRTNAGVVLGLAMLAAACGEGVIGDATGAGGGSGGSAEGGSGGRGGGAPGGSGGAIAPSCGDGACVAPEACDLCVQDCGTCASCGDGACVAPEACDLCVEDCGACDRCGDGACVAPEACDLCVEDCGTCDRCGDGACVAPEACDLCVQDCGACVTCGANERRVGDVCECVPGFTRDGAGVCLAGPVPEPATRSEQEVCAHFAQEHVGVFPEWEPTPGSVDPCDPGTVPDAAQQNGIRRVNLYRWLAGLPPILFQPALFPQQQACAVVEDALGHLDHFPPQGTACWSQEGASGAGSSNLAWGGGLADSVDLYVGDGGVSSLGHRRWVLNPGMSETAFGIKNAFSCMYSFSGGGSANPEFISWPPPGFVPTGAAAGTFSFGSSRLPLSQGTRVSISVDGAPAVDVEPQYLQFGYGSLNTISFEPPGGAFSVWRPGAVIAVEVIDPSGSSAAWTTRFTACD